MADNYRDKLKNNKIIQYLRNHAVVASQPELDEAGTENGNRRYTIYVNLDTVDAQQFQNDKESLFASLDNFFCEDKEWTQCSSILTKQLPIESEDAQDIIKKIRTKKNLFSQTDEEIYNKYSERFYDKDAQATFPVDPWIDDPEFKQLIEGLLKIEISSDAVRRQFDKYSSKRQKIFDIAGDALIHDGEDIFLQRNSDAAKRIVRSSHKLIYLIDDNWILENNPKCSPNERLFRIAKPHEFANSLVDSGRVERIFRNLDFEQPDDLDVKIVFPKIQRGTLGLGESN